MGLSKHVLPALNQGIRRCESALIGHDRRPAYEVVSNARWHPDPRGAYCRQCGSSFHWSLRDCSCRPGTLANRHGTIVRLSRYDEPMSTWIREMKYRSWDSMAEVLGMKLGDSIIQCGAFDHVTSPLLVPVPMPFTRRFVRGMDHAALICAGVSKTSGFKVFQPLKQRRGMVQSGATSSQRSRKPDPFEVSWKGRLCSGFLRGRPVVLIDDVRTTGRTIGLAARALKRCGASVVGCGVLAVADERPARRCIG